MTIPTNAKSGSPQRGPLMTIDIDRVRQVADLLKPYVQSDGGDFEIAGITPEGIVQVRMLGSCKGCPSAETLAVSIERNLKDNVEGVAGVCIVA